MDLLQSLTAMRNGVTDDDESTASAAGSATSGMRSTGLQSRGQWKGDSARGRGGSSSRPQSKRQNQRRANDAAAKRSAAASKASAQHDDDGATAGGESESRGLDRPIVNGTNLRPEEITPEIQEKLNKIGPPPPSVLSRASEEAVRTRGKLDHTERALVSDFVRRVEARVIRVARGELARELRAYVNPSRSKMFFEKLISRRKLNQRLGGLLMGRKPKVGSLGREILDRIGAQSEGKQKGRARSRVTSVSSAGDVHTVS